MTSTVRYHRRRLADTVAALRAARSQEPRAQLAAHQQRRLEAVVRHAASHSPFYRRWSEQTGALGEGPVELARLPVVDNTVLMEHFDALVCDRRLRPDQLLDWVGRLAVDHHPVPAQLELGGPGAQPAPPAAGLDRRRRPRPHRPPGDGHPGHRPAPGPGPAGHPAPADAPWSAPPPSTAAATTSSRLPPAPAAGSTSTPCSSPCSPATPGPRVPSRPARPGPALPRRPQASGHGRRRPPRGPPRPGRHAAAPGVGRP
jgi:hypothetical protein